VQEEGNCLKQNAAILMSLHNTKCDVKKSGTCTSVEIICTLLGSSRSLTAYK
jgi:hypothetical protein